MSRVSIRICCKNVIIASALILMICRSGLAQEGNPTKIGVIVPLSGPLAEYGNAFKNGIQLAQRDTPSIQSVCSFAFEDSRYDPKTAVTALHRLVSDGIKIIFNWGGPTSTAVAPLADRLKVAMFVLAMDPRVSQNSSHVLRFANSGAEYGAKLAAAVKQAGYHKIGIFKTENDYLNDVLGGLKSSVPPDVTIEEISYLPSDQDFRTGLTKARTEKFDAVGVFLISGQVSTFYQQMRQQRLHLATFGTDFFESKSEIAASGPTIDGAFFANNSVEAKFQRAYQDQFGNDFQITYAANGYDFATLLCRDLAARVSFLEPKSILESIDSATRLDGMLGKARFENRNGDKYFNFPIVIRRVMGQSIVTLD